MRGRRVFTASYSAVVGIRQCWRNNIFANVNAALYARFTLFACKKKKNETYDAGRKATRENAVMMATRRKKIKIKTRTRRMKNYDNLYVRIRAQLTPRFARREYSLRLTLHICVCVCVYARTIMRKSIIGAHEPE